MSTLLFVADTHARYCKYSDLAGLFCDGGNVHLIAAKQSVNLNAIVMEVLESLFARLYSAINDKALKITAKRERERECSVAPKRMPVGSPGLANQ